ncbi:MAG: PEP-CTERM sorting domain-containing protein, partial [bacterium]|nr:PEP-CTERM sorting domain-containing protein [bacterium]
ASQIDQAAGSTLAFQIRQMFKAGTYTIMEAGTLTGTFVSPATGLGDYVSTGAANDGLAYSATALTVTVDKDLLAGDANLDTTVDEDDALALITHWYTGANPGSVWGEGDSDFDGDVDEDDALFIITNWLASADTDPGTGAGFYDTEGNIFVDLNTVAQYKVFVGDADHEFLAGLDALTKDGAEPDWVSGFTLLSDKVDLNPDEESWSETAFMNVVSTPELTPMDSGVNVNVSLLGPDVKLWMRYATMGHEPEFTELNLVPEPSTLVLLSMGALAGLLFWRRRRAA